MWNSYVVWKENVCFFVFGVSYVYLIIVNCYFGLLSFLCLLWLFRDVFEVDSNLIILVFNCVWFSVDLIKGYVELFLKGIDVGGFDFVLKLKWLEEKEKKDKEWKE